MSQKKAFRLTNKQVVPTIKEMTEYCAENAERFSMTMIG